MPDMETEDLTFKYNGVVRVVKDAVRKVNGEGNAVITGRELIKGSRITDEAKNYRVDRIEGEIRRADIPPSP